MTEAGVVAFNCHACRKAIATLGHFVRCECGATYVTSVLRIDGAATATLPAAIRERIAVEAA